MNFHPNSRGIREFYEHEWKPTKNDSNTPEKTPDERTTRAEEFDAALQSEIEEGRSAAERARVSNPEPPARNKYERTPAIRSNSRRNILILLGAFALGGLVWERQGVINSQSETIEEQSKAINGLTHLIGADDEKHKSQIRKLSTENRELRAWNIRIHEAENARLQQVERDLEGRGEVPLFAPTHPRFKLSPDTTNSSQTAEQR